MRGSWLRLRPRQLSRDRNLEFIIWLFNRNREQIISLLISDRFWCFFLIAYPRKPALGNGRFWNSFTFGAAGDEIAIISIWSILSLQMFSIICYLLTESEVISGKSQTEALMYWPRSIHQFQVSSGLDKVETGYNLLMEENALTKCLIVQIHTGLLAVTFICRLGQLYH